MARKKVTYAALMKMAAEYQVDKNILFQSAAKTYTLQMQTITRIQEQIESMDDLMTKKTYVKGSENVSVSDLVRELPKQCDSANKTLDKMLDIIERLGTKPQVKGKLEKFMMGGEID